MTKSRSSARRRTEMSASLRLDSTVDSCFLMESLPSTCARRAMVCSPMYRMLGSRTVMNRPSSVSACCRSFSLDECPCLITRLTLSKRMEWSALLLFTDSEASVRLITLDSTALSEATCTSSLGASKCCRNLRNLTCSHGDGVW